MSIYNNCSSIVIPKKQNDQIDSSTITEQFLKSHSTPLYEKINLLASYLDTCTRKDDTYQALKIMESIPIRFDSIEVSDKLKLKAVLESIKKIVVTAIQHKATGFITIEPELLNTFHKLRNDRAIWINSMKVNPNGLGLVTADFQNDPLFVLEAVKINGLSLRFASNEVKKNKKIVEAAMENNPLALAFADYKLKQDTSLLKLLLTNFKLPTDVNTIPFVGWENLNAFNNHILKLIIEGNEGNKELVSALIKIKPLMLKYASPSLQNDPDIIAQASKRNIHALQHAGIEVLNEDHPINKEIIAYKALYFSDQSIEARNHKKIANAAIKLDYLNYKHLSPNLKKDIPFAIQAIQVNPNTFFLVDQSIQMDPDILRTTLEGDGSILEVLPKKVRHDPKFVFVSLHKYTGKHSPFKFAGLAIKSNLEYSNRAFRIDPKSANHSYLNIDKVKSYVHAPNTLENFQGMVTELNKINI